MATSCPIVNAQATTVVDPCDTSLLRPRNDPLGYGPRGDRCEGLYIREVSGSGGLFIASLTEPVGPLDNAAGGPLRLEWRAPAAWPVRLRAVALKRRVYYRMDAIRPSGAQRYDWPTDVLATLRLDAREIGLVGWVQQRFGDRVDDVYVPLSVTRDRAPAWTGRYVALVVPGAELTEMFVTVTATNADGVDTHALIRDRPLRYGFYPAERGIKVELPALDHPGLYRLRVGSTLRRGGSASREIRFYHGGG